MSLVRVRKDGLEFSVGQSYAEANGLEVLDEAAADRFGVALPVTRRGGRPRKPKADLSPAKSTTNTDSTKEN